MDNPRLKYWPILFLLIFIEGIITLVWLGSIPPDVKNAVLLGFSARRLAMMAFIMAVLTASALGGWFSWQKRTWRARWLNPNLKPRLFQWSTIGTLVIASGFELAILFLRYYDPARFSPVYIRSRPLLVYLLLVCAQTAIWILVIRFGRDLRLFWRQTLLWILGWVGVSLLVYWAISPAGRGILDTWWYIQTFDPVRYERHGADYCAAEYSSSIESQYQRASNLRLKLVHIDRSKALLAIFNKITAGAKTNTEKHLKLLKFIQKSTYHTNDISSYSEGDWVYDPIVLLELGDMWCTQGAILAIDLFGSAGYPGRLVQLANHQIGEIYYDGDWHYFDTDSFGNGETVLDNKGKIPSVAEMSKGDYQKLDALPAYQESLVMDCTSDHPEGNLYPSYSYFSSQAYKKDVPQTYYTGRDSPYAFENGWKAADKISPSDTVKLYDLPAIHTPTKPRFTQVQFDPAYTTLTVSFTASDPDNDLAGFQVFVSDHSRGWDYNQFYGSGSAKVYWADPGGWKPDMYEQLFVLPPANLGSMKLSANKNQVNITVKHGITYFITVMPFDSYGLSVGRLLYPESNELKVTVH
jgi:hypothetical protein